MWPRRCIALRQLLSTKCDVRNQGAVLPFKSLAKGKWERSVEGKSIEPVAQGERKWIRGKQWKARIRGLAFVRPHLRRRVDSFGYLTPLATWLRYSSQGNTAPWLLGYFHSRKRCTNKGAKLTRPDGRGCLRIEIGTVKERKEWDRRLR